MANGAWTPVDEKADTSAWKPVESSSSELDDKLHKALDDRPLWRKALGMGLSDEETAKLPPELQQHMKDVKAGAQRQLADQLGGVYSGYKEGAITGAKTVPFMALGPAGGAAAEAVGGGALGLAANAGVQGLGGAAISKAEGASNTGAGIAGVIGAAAPYVEAVMPTAAGLAGKAKEWYQSALKPSPSLPAAQTERLVQTGLESSIPVSKGGVNRLSRLIDDVNEKISDVIASRPNAPIDPNAVAQRADQARRTFANQVNAGEDLASLDKSKQQFLTEQGQVPAVPPKPTGVLDAQGNPIMTAGTPAQAAPAMTAEKAQAMKQGTYQQLKGKAYGELRSAAVESQKALARGLKEELATQFPELAELNAADSKFLNFQPILERAVNRIGNHQLGGIGTPLAAAGAKAITNSNAVAATVGTIKAVMDDPMVKSRLAIVLNRAGVPMAQAILRVGGFSKSLAQAYTSATPEPPSDQLPDQLPLTQP